MGESRKHPTPLEQIQSMLDRLTDAEIAKASTAADYLWQFCQLKIGRKDWWMPILALHGTLAGEQHRRTTLEGEAHDHVMSVRILAVASQAHIAPWR